MLYKIIIRIWANKGKSKKVWRTDRKAAKIDVKDNLIMWNRYIRKESIDLWAYCQLHRKKK